MALNRRLSLVLSIAALGATAERISASLSDLHIAAGETTLFSDDFGSSTIINTTTDIATVGLKQTVGTWYLAGTSSPGLLTTYGGNSDTVWAPSTTNITTQLKAKISATPLDLSAGPVNIYYRVAIPTVERKPAWNRVEIQLSTNINNSKDGYFGFTFQNGGTASNGGTSAYYYYTPSGMKSISTASTQTTPSTGFANFRLTVSFNADGSYTLVEAVDMNNSGVYLPFGTPPLDSTTISAADVANGAMLGQNSGAGKFAFLSIMQRNTNGDSNYSTNDYDYIDAVAVTQSTIPEPTTLGFLGCVVGALLRRRRPSNAM